MGCSSAPASWRGCGGATPSPPTPSVPPLRLLLPRHKTHKQQRAAAGLFISDPVGDHRPHLLFDSATTHNEKGDARTSARRRLMLLLLPLAVSPPALSSAAPIEEGQLERYTDQPEGFTLLRPSSWLKVEKAGATALFEEEGKGSNSIGVVVSPVRLASLRDFGTPQFVADKLIQAERRKESTKDAEVITAAERSGHGGLSVYEFEYTVDSNRGGMKRIFSAAFVASKKLYLLNIAYSDRPENPLNSQTRMVLEKVLHSFDTAS